MVGEVGDAELTAFAVLQILKVTQGVTQDEPAFCLHLCYNFHFDAMDKLAIRIVRGR
jgi:hypothetical protein